MLVKVTSKEKTNMHGVPTGRASTTVKKLPTNKNRVYYNYYGVTVAIN